MHERFKVVCMPCKALYKCSALLLSADGYRPGMETVGTQPREVQINMMIHDSDVDFIIYCLRDFDILSRCV